ncbi:hypothetical protein QE152_g11318 [Popillia japonica]|uniref:Uncharacterized protein n=1 Tax=Popillia japonica TaxID=7064 RepID=A0AAW1LSH1_POPJA
MKGLAARTRANEKERTRRIGGIKKGNYKTLLYDRVECAARVVLKVCVCRPPITLLKVKSIRGLRDGCWSFGTPLGRISITMPGIRKLESCLFHVGPSSVAVFGYST